jgi:hypothetical protein
MPKSKGVGDFSTQIAIMERRQEAYARDVQLPGSGSRSVRCRPRECRLKGRSPLVRPANGKLVQLLEAGDMTSETSPARSNFRKSKEFYKALD